MGEESEGRKFQFLRNGDAEPSDFDWSKGIESARRVISEAMSAKNIAFLLVKSLPTTTPFSRPMPTPLEVGSA